MVVYHSCQLSDWTLPSLWSTVTSLSQLSSCQPPTSSLEISIILVCKACLPNYLHNCMFLSALKGTYNEWLILVVKVEEVIICIKIVGGRLSRLFEKKVWTRCCSKLSERNSETSQLQINFVHQLEITTKSWKSDSQQLNSFCIHAKTLAWTLWWWSTQHNTRKLTSSRWCL